MEIVKDDLEQIMPNCRFPDEWLRPLNLTLRRFEINTIQRAAMFLGQVAHESNELNTLQENLNYSPQRIVDVWPNRFPDLSSALQYGRNPERLANKVYADRMGNGPENEGDGFKYRGRGLLQITGKKNYQKVADALEEPGILDMPDHLIEPRYAALSAGAYWDARNLNKFADKLTATTVKKVTRALTKVINGGFHGVEQRQAFTQKALEVLDKEFTL